MPRTSPEELVLVIPALAVPLGLPHGLSADPAWLWHAMAATPQFLPRPEAEATTAFRQIVPYVVLLHPFLPRACCYLRLRGGGEAGLHGRLSIGFGGHVGPQDTRSSPRDTLLAAMYRELAEEVAPVPVEPRILGLLNDPADPVGARHLGVLVAATSPGPVRLLEVHKHAPVGPGFLPLATLRHLAPAMESWSALALSAVATQLRPGAILAG